MIVTIVVVVIISIVAVVLRDDFPRNFTEYLEQLGKREDSGRFDS